MRIPVACTLDVGDARDRVAAWRGALADTVQSSARLSPTRLELSLDPERARMASLAHLARQEKACCGFFSFAFEIVAGGVTLAVSVPAESSGVLDDFAGLVPAP